MDATPLSAQVREDFGKGAARKLRATGQIPAIIYRDGSEPTHIVLDPAELRLIYYRSGNPNTLLAIQVGDETQVCLLTATQKHPLSRDLLHADFYQVAEDQDVLVEVPITHTGKPVGVVAGGKIQVLRRTVPVRCLPAHIPASITVDISDLDLGEIRRVSQVTAPENTAIVYETDFNVFSVKGRRAAPAAAAGA